MAPRKGFHTVTPYLVTNDVDGLVAFVDHGLGAVQTSRAEMGPGRFHVEMQIGDSMVMIGGGPGSNPVTAMLLLYVDDVDALYHRALGAGAQSVQNPSDMRDGERRAGVEDAFGNSWYFAGPKTTKT